MLNTLRIWPYFKFYPKDWLTSNTIILMTLEQTGAYIGLLCNAWSEDCCTLPREPDLLKRLAKWNDEQHGDFAPVLACFPLTRNGKRRHNPRLSKERLEATTYRDKQSDGGRKGMESRYRKPPVVRTVKDRSADALACTVIDFDTFWAAYPNKVGPKAARKAWDRAKDKPVIAEVLNALDRAKKSQKWTKDHGEFIPNPTTWINQGRWADQPIADGHGAAKIPPFPPKNDPIERGRWRRTYGDPSQHGYSE